MRPSSRILAIICAFTWTLLGQSNETALENTSPGTTSWLLTNPALNREIEGYASLTSVNAGDSISFFASTAAPSYTMDVYRLGWYGGTGAREMVPTISRTGVLQTTPAVDSFGRFECNWTNPYILSIPVNWVSGIYLVKLTASTGYQSYIQFVVREDTRASAILFQHSVSTDEAYNNWPGPAAGGKSLYTFNSSGSVAAVKVSFNRPYFIDTDAHNFTQVGTGFLLRWEVMMLRWIEKQGYDVTYCDNVDVHENASLLLSHQAFLSVGHDEYWSWEMRANVQAARDKGVNIGFFSADPCYWQIRLETSPISGAQDRTMVAYKETAEAGLYGVTVTNDPTTNRCLITTNWRFNPCILSEQNLIGVQFIEASVGCPSTGTCVDMVIADGSSWALAGSGLTTGSHIPGLLGYEVDGQLYSDSPAGTHVIAKSPIPILNGDAANHPFSEVVTYTAASGATVFAVGTFQWTWGLDDWGAPAQRPSQLSPAVQTITQNVLKKFAPAGTPVSQTITFGRLSDVLFGVQPFTIAATASSGLPVVFASTPPAVCTVTGNTVAIPGAGTCSITASQSGNSQYLPAIPVTKSFTVNQAAQTISFAAPASVTLPATAFSLTASATSGLAVSFASTTTSICTVSVSTLTPLTAGTCSITASQPGDGRYLPAIPVTTSFTVNQGAQTISFAAPASVTLPAAAFSLTASATSGLPVSFTSTTTSICTVSGSTLTPLAAGTCSITAAQAGNTNYAGATPITRSFTINPAPTDGGGGTGGGGGGGGAGGGVGPVVATGMLTASLTTLSLNVPVNSSSTQTVTLTYRSPFQGGPLFKATLQAGGWLTVSPGSGTMTLASFDGTTYTYTTTVSIKADGTFFGAGNNLSGTINFTAADGTASTSVTMRTIDPPKFTIGPQSLSFTYRQGDSKMPAPQSLSVSSTATGTTFLPSASTTTGGNWLSVPAVSGTTPGSIPVSVSVANLAPGLYSGKVTISYFTSTLDEPVTLNILPANAPVITQGGVGPVYSKSTSIQAGSWVSAYGTNLADTTVVWNGDFPTSLGGVSVTVNSKPAYLWYVSPTQINFQAPDDAATGTVNVVVTTSHGNFTSTVTLTPASPSFSLLGTHAAGVILTPDGSGAYADGVYDLVGPLGGFSFNTRPVQPGEILELFGVGFGPTDPAEPAGRIFTGQAPTVYPVTITIGGLPATVSFAGLTQAGMYQINVTVPNAGSGDHALQATVNGIQTQPGPVVTIQ